MHAEAMISLVKRKRGYSNLEKGAILLVTSRKQIVSGKKRRSKTNLKRIYSDRLERGATQSRESTRFFGKFIPKQD